jgi:hypothetical protein
MNDATSAANMTDEKAFTMIQMHQSDFSAILWLTQECSTSKEK